MSPLAQAPVRYTGDVFVAGRRREMEQIARLLERAQGGAGGLLVLVGPAGSGKTAMVEAAAGEARRRGFAVLRASPAGGQPGGLVWAQLLRDTDAPDDLAASLLGGNAGTLDLDSAARHLVSGSPRLIVVDDVDRGGPDAAEVLLGPVAVRCAAAATAVIVTAAAPLGLGPVLRLGPLSEEDLGLAAGGLDGEAAHALWVASRGLPGVARQLAQELADLGEHDDPVVHLALRAPSTTAFLDVDTNLVRLLEVAAGRAADDALRARVLARLARELLDDASSSARRRALADEALQLARRAADPARWPRCWTPGCTPCGIRRARRTGWRPGRKLSTWPGPPVMTGANATASSGGSWP